MTVGRVLISGLRVQTPSRCHHVFYANLAYRLAMAEVTDTTIRDFANRLCQVQVRSQNLGPASDNRPFIY